MSSNPNSMSSHHVRILAVLALINFVNFAARLIFVPLIPLLREHLHPTDSQLGALSTVLLVVLAIASILFGFLADRFSRKAIIGFGILFWSAATFAGGLVSTFTAFLIARAFVGLGEAAYAPAAQSMISGAFPFARRAFAQSIFASGMLLGGAAGQVFAGMMAPRFGWQSVFFIVGLFGIIPALALMSIDDPPRGPCSEAVPFWRLLEVPAFVTMLFAGMCVTFASTSLIAWGIDYVMSYKGFSLREASVSLSVIALISAVLGVLAGGWVADQLQKRFAYGRIIAIACAFLLAAPFLMLAIQSDEKRVVLFGLFGAGFFMCWYHGPVTAVIHDMMPKRAHGTSIGVYMFATQLVGAWGAQVVGKISDLHDLQLGLQISVGVLVLGAFLLLLVIHFIRRDGLKHRCLDIFHVEAGD